MISFKILSIHDLRQMTDLYKLHSIKKIYIFIKRLQLILIRSFKLNVLSY